MSTLSNKKVSVEHVEAREAGIDENHWAKNLASTAFRIDEESKTHYFPYSRVTSTIFIPSGDQGPESHEKFIEYFENYNEEPPVEHIKVISVDNKKENSVDDSEYF